MTGGATVSDSPVINGRNARLYGHPRDSCPYAEGSNDRAAWLQAWDEAVADDDPAVGGPTAPAADTAEAEESPKSGGYDDRPASSQPDNAKGGYGTG